MSKRNKHKVNPATGLTMQQLQDLPNVEIQQVPAADPVEAAIAEELAAESDTVSQSEPAPDTIETPALTALETGLIAEVKHTVFIADEIHTHRGKQAETFKPVYQFIREHKQITPLMVQSFVAELQTSDKDEPDTIVMMKRARDNVRKAFNRALEKDGFKIVFCFVDKNGKASRQGTLTDVKLEKLADVAPVPFETVAKTAVAKALKSTPAKPTTDEPTVVETAIIDAAAAVESAEVPAITQDDLERSIYDSGIAAIGSGLDPVEVLAAFSIVSNQIKTAIQNQKSRAKIAAKAEADQLKALEKAEAEAEADNPELAL